MTNGILEKLWSDHFAEECAVIDGEKQKDLAKKALEQHRVINEMMTELQRDALEKYLEILFQMQDEFVKRAFFKGCEFASAFLLEMAERHKK